MESTYIAERVKTLARKPRLACVVTVLPVRSRDRKIVRRGVFFMI